MNRIRLSLILGTVSLPALLASAGLTPAPLPKMGGPLDVAAYRALLVRQVDLWNGGPDGQEGLGAYLPGFKGVFNVNLNRDWSQQDTRSVTAVAQARAIYMNVEAYRASGAPRFLKIIQAGVSELQAHFLDRTRGGYYWEVGTDGTPIDRNKQGYGNMHVMFALAQAYGVTQDPAYLKAALMQLGVIEKHFLDPRFPGGVRPGFNADFTEIAGVNNVDTFTHCFEALLAMHDVTTGAEHARVQKLVNTAGTFLVSRLARPETGHPDRAYVTYNDDQSWNPPTAPYTRGTQWSGAGFATPGHGIELGYLLSRAVERGYPRTWLETGARLQRFADAHAIIPATGGMLHDTSDYTGQPLEGNPDNNVYIWWAQAETAREALHRTVVLGEPRWNDFQKVQKFVLGHFLDVQNGGWYQNVDRDSLAVGDTTKGNVWTMNYHETMFYAEVLRLASVYPRIVAGLR